ITSTVLPPATASVPMVRAMFPVPMMLMLLMTRGLFLVHAVVCGSDHRGAAVGDQFHHVDVAGVVGGEEQGDGRDLLGAAHLSPRDQGLERRLGRLVEQVLLH